MASAVFSSVLACWLITREVLLYRKRKVANITVGFVVGAQWRRVPYRYFEHTMYHATVVFKVAGETYTGYCPRFREVFWGDEIEIRYFYTRKGYRVEDAETPVDAWTLAYYIMPHILYAILLNVPVLLLYLTFRFFGV